MPGIHYVVDPGTARISATPRPPRCSACPSSRSPRRAPTSAPGARAASPTASRSACTPRTTSTSRPDFTEPEILRTSLASVLLQMISVGVVSTPDEVAAFPFVEPPTRARSRTASSCCPTWARSPPAAGGTGPPHGGGPQARAAAHRPAPGPHDRRGRAPRRRVRGRDHRRRPVHPGPARAPQRQARGGRPAASALLHPHIGPAGLSQPVGIPAGPPARALRQRVPAHVPFRVPELPARARVAGPGPAIQAGRQAAGHHMSRPAPRQARRRCRRRRGRRPSCTRGTRTRSTARCSRACSRRSACRTRARSRASSYSHLRGEAKAIAHEARPQARHNEYLGTRGARFAIQPGSPLSKKPPAFVMAAELVETNRLWARDVARIDPAWAEELAGDLAKHTYSEPHWSTKQGAAMAHEKVLLYGVPIVAERRMLWGKVNPESARAVHPPRAGPGRVDHPPRVLEGQPALLADAAEVEARTRTLRPRGGRGGAVRLLRRAHPRPRGLRRALRQVVEGRRRAHPDLLTFDPAMLMPDAAEVDPAHSRTVAARRAHAAAHLPIRAGRRRRRRHRPHSARGAPPRHARRLRLARARHAPRAHHRHHQGPAQARAACWCPPPTSRRRWSRWLADQPVLGGHGARRRRGAVLAHHFAQAVRELRGVEIPPDAFDDSRLPAHLRMTFRVVEDRHGGGELVSTRGTTWSPSSAGSRRGPSRRCARRCATRCAGRWPSGTGTAGPRRAVNGRAGSGRRRGAGRRARPHARARAPSRATTWNAPA